MRYIAGIVIGIGLILLSACRSCPPVVTHGGSVTENEPVAVRSSEPSEQPQPAIKLQEPAKEQPQHPKAGEGAG